MACSRADSDATIHLLLSKDGDVNARTNGGQTALHFCASKNNLDAARLLMAQKPPASARLKDKRGQLPLHRAAAAGNATDAMSRAVRRRRISVGPCGCGRRA